jgi:uncharacterized zinc-type alcohol dehydrogenase-like protein
MKFKAYAAEQAGGVLKPFEYAPGELKRSQVQIKIEACGICHSDLSVWRNEWGMSTYPFVPGHEVVGLVEDVGADVHNLKPGQRVGAGWYSASCMVCDACMAGDHNLCASAEGIMMGRHGGFADRVRLDAAWTTPVPETIPANAAGPLFCGGITVFNPIVQCGVKPTDHVGVVGIGGLGHMALQFLDAWGCDVTAFTSNPAKADEARRLGADRVVSSRDAEAIRALGPVLDFILVTANVPMPWDAFIAVLRPRGRLHVVGAVLEPIPVSVFSLLTGQKSVSASPLGSPATVRRMLEFAGRHRIAPQVETLPMAKVNEALAKLEKEKPAHRLVLLAT